MEFKDYYKAMGVAEDATADDIKRAYRKLARKYHPDVSKEKDAERHFKDVGEAYEVLKDPEKRREYDAVRRYHAEGGDFRPPPDWQSQAGFSGGGYTATDAAGFSDFFESLFGRGAHLHPGGHGPGAAQGAPGDGFRLRGEALRYRLAIPLEEAHRGGIRSIQLQVPRYDAAGRSSAETKTLNFHIPPGVVDGQSIRLRGQGAPGLGGGSAGDLYLEIELQPHPRYSVAGRDVTLALPITPWEAAMGAVVQCPTLDGEVKLTIPPGAASGQKMRLKGRGMPARHPGHPHPGDQYVVLQIQTPPATTEAAKEFYRRMERELPFSPRAPLGK